MGARGSEQPDTSMCGHFRLTPVQLRRQRFRTYHLTTATEMHDKYLWFSCWQEGVIVVGLNRFRFRARAGNLMETTYPDGKWKNLGGAYDDDESEGDDPHWQELQCR